MYYKFNVNKIHSSLLDIFDECDIDDKNKTLMFRGHKPVNKSTNNQLEIVLEVSKNDITDSNTNIEWGYYTNSNSLDNKIAFNTNIEDISNILEDVIQSNKLSSEYLNQIKEPKNMEKLEIKDQKTLLHINETYELNLNTLRISKKKFKTYMKENHGLDISQIVTRYRDLTTGALIDTNYVIPKIGDETEITLEYNNNINTNEILKINEDIRKIPRVENLNIIGNNLIFNFDSRVFVIVE
jgi:hypothetical protein